jgi:hypothetical protein
LTAGARADLVAMTGDLRFIACWVDGGEEDELA